MSRVIITAFVGLLLAGCGGGTASQAADTAQVQYVLEVSGANADITIQTPDGGTSQSSNVESGTVLDATFPANDFVYLSAQATDTGATVTCTIIADEQVISTNTSKGDYVIATCDGNAVPCPECRQAAEQAAADAAAKIPAGFAAAPNDPGIYYRLTSNPGSCTEKTCVKLELISERDCPKGIKAAASQLTSGGRTTATDNAASDGAVASGQQVDLTLGWESAPDNGSLTLEYAFCLGG